MLTDYKSIYTAGSITSPRRNSAACYFLALGPERLAELSDAEIEHYIQHHGGPRSYYLRTFQFFLRERGLIQAPEPDMLTRAWPEYLHKPPTSSGPIWISSAAATTRQRPSRV